LEIVPGIHQIKLPLTDNPLGYINTYLIQGTGGWALLDTGWNDQESFESLSGQLKELQLGFQDISLIIITHMHPDHIGQAGRIQQLSGASLAVHEVEKEYLDSKLLWTDLVYQEISIWLRSNGVPDDALSIEMNSSGGMKSLIPEASPDRALSDGDTVSTGVFDLQVIWTPGHSNGHICLYEPSKKLLFTGDHILPGITPNISIHMQSHEDPLLKYINSLKKMKDLDMALGLPAHEEPFTNLRKRIDELLAHHEQRKLEIIETIVSEEKTAYHISSEITWMEGNMDWDDMEPLDKRIAVTEALAHLESLKAEKRIVRAEKGGLAFYRAA
jgi:glyoxylase-like metal-dependent hydrolase (beta-lactamase superfamily II)